MRIKWGHWNDFQEVTVDGRTVGMTELKNGYKGGLVYALDDSGTIGRYHDGKFIADMPHHRADLNGKDIKLPQCINWED